MAHRFNKKPKKGSIQHWLSKTIMAGETPLFVILDDKTATEDESLASELEWVERLAAIGHPLFNRWEEHRDIIEISLTLQLHF